MKNLIALSFFCIITICASAQKKNVIRTAANGYSVGAYANPFAFERIAPHTGQNNDLHWDWAACIGMVLNYDGLNVRQEDIMSLVSGQPEEPLSAPQDLIFAINKTTPHAWVNLQKFSQQLLR